MKKNTISETQLVIKDKNNNIIMHSYHGVNIPFTNNGEIMISATDMIKAFPKKNMGNFLRNAQTKSFIKALQNRYANSHHDILTTKQGGKNQGTWMHRKLALKFAAWLSPEFELWVYDKIDEILRGEKPTPKISTSNGYYITQEEWDELKKYEQGYLEALQKQSEINNQYIDLLERFNMKRDKIAEPFRNEISTLEIEIGKWMEDNCKLTLELNHVRKQLAETAVELNGYMKDHIEFLQAK